MVLLGVHVLQAQLLHTAPGSCNGVMAACTKLPPSQGTALPPAVLPLEKWLSLSLPVAVNNSDLRSDYVARAQV